MTTDEAVKFFGSKRALVAALKLKGGRQTIHAWGERPPMTRQYELEVRTNGRLKADLAPEERNNAGRFKTVAQAAAA